MEGGGPEAAEGAAEEEGPGTETAHPNYQREWYEKNKDYQNAWRFRNPEKYRWAQQRQLDAGIISAKPLGQINLRHEGPARIVITE